MIKLDSKGPVLYSQERVGLYGKTFFVHKFRSMKQDAEAKCGPVLAAEGDPRITKFGRFMRATRLDELPQLFNVLQGEMSIVGPRPDGRSSSSSLLPKNLNMITGITSNLASQAWHR